MHLGNGSKRKSGGWKAQFRASRWLEKQVKTIAETRGMNISEFLKYCVEKEVKQIDKD